MPKLKYFPHDTAASSDDKIIKLMRVHGDIGYSTYYRVLEVIYGNGKPVDIGDLCHTLHLNKKQKKALDFMVEIGVLFKKNEEIFSKRINSYIISYSEKNENLKKRVAKHRDNQSSIKNVTRYDTVTERVTERLPLYKENRIEESTEIQVQVVEEIPSKENAVVLAHGNNKFFEMFRRVAGRHISDEELLAEIAKFENRYPNAHPNSSGALINTWVGNIGRDLTKSWQKEPELSEYQKNHKAELEKRRNYKPTD